MSKYIDTVTKLDDSKFTPLPHPNTRSLSRDGINANVMYSNLWSMFTIPEHPRDPAKNGYGREISVSDFAWTEEVKEAFYAWGDHPKLVKRMKKMRGLTWGMWALQAEPAELEQI